MKILTCEQRSDEWFAARMGRPTASGAAKILTSQGKKSTTWKAYMHELIAERRGHELPRFEPNAAMLEGIDREAESQAAYSFIKGFEVREVGLVIHDTLCASASPDGLIYKDDVLLHGLELKNPNPGTFIGEMLAKKVPAKYIPQIHMSMAVAGLDRWDYGCYLPNEEPLIHEVYRDEYTATFEQALTDFCGELEKICADLGMDKLENVK